MASAPGSDAGSVPNLRFSFAGSYRRVEEGGWSREVTARELPIARTLAGVNMHLGPGGVRELHWHKQAEWAYMLAGEAQITAVRPDGEPFAADVRVSPEGIGDLWYFPAGIPHSIQGLASGCEFLLVFDDGEFSEDATFLVSDWLAHTPREIVALDLGVAPRELARLPGGERYIFPARLPEPAGAAPGGIAGDGANLRPDGYEPFAHRLGAAPARRFDGGSVRIADSRDFPVSRTVAAALVEVRPGGLRELHWHPNAAEWQYYIAGSARMGVFAAEGNARTFDYAAGDVGYVPFAMGHYVENTGSGTLRFLELFRAERFEDVSLRRWLAGTPARLVADHLGIADEVASGLRGEERPVLARAQPRTRSVPE